MKAYTANLPHNQAKIDRLIGELHYAQRQGDTKYFLKIRRRKIWEAKERDRKGQMA